ncbi:hypothetical protein CLOSYM_03318 [[Clostridium] symbiosum ATCC 14940]|uniref:Uncharacterized protein n=1 Tax=[Clostridium] symbiosum ATCC 14940 TaxID=411472 RepID=A0ABC9TUX4_CLOSY|nr:hypothetical protein CLOSYM_03318 [[Clostridium] symbiosum ATCC 14940]
MEVAAMTQNKRRQITTEIFLLKKVRILRRDSLVAYMKFFMP